MSRFLHTHPLSSPQRSCLFFWKTCSLSFILSCICQEVSVGWLAWPRLALGNAKAELSAGFIELLGSRGCYQKDVSCGGLQLICHYRSASLSPREVSVWRMCRGHDDQICMMNLKFICLLTSHVPHEVSERAFKSISLKLRHVMPVSFYFSAIFVPWIYTG